MPIRQESTEIYDASVSADATGAWVQLPTRIEEVLLVLDATALTGTNPTVRVRIEDTVDSSPSAAGEVRTLAEFAPTFGTGDQQQQLTADEWQHSTARRYARAQVLTYGTSPSARLTVRLIGRAE